MKLKYYLRGIGIGVILTAIIMGFALGGRKATMSDAQVIQRAKELGMTEGGVLTASSGEVENNGEALSSSSTEALDEAGEEVSEKVNEAVTLTSEPIPALAKEKEETENEKNEDRTNNDKSASQASKLTSSQSSESASSNETGTDRTEVSSGKETKADESNATSSRETQTDESNASSSRETQTEQSDTASGRNTDTQGSAASVSSSVNASADTKVSLNTEDKTVVIPGGTSSDGVALVLYNAGVIDNAAAFNRYLIDQGKDRIIRSGTKVIPVGSSYAEIAAIITK